MAFRFPDLKAPGKHATLTFDFTNELPDGVTVSSATVDYQVASGAESPVTLVNDGAGSAAAAGKKWLQPVLGGIDGVEYFCTCTATLSTGSTPSKLTAILGVRDPSVVWPVGYPSDLALTTVDALGAYLDPSPAGSRSDFLLRDVITRASATILAAANLDACYAVDRTEVRNGNGRDRIVPMVSPINHVTAVTVDEVSIPASQSAMDAGFVYDSGLIYLRGYTFSRGIRNVAIAYNSGFAPGSQVATILEHACLSTCALWFKRRAHIDQNSMTAPGGIGTINFTGADLPKEAWTIINQIKRVAPVTP